MQVAKTHFNRGYVTQMDDLPTALLTPMQNHSPGCPLKALMTKKARAAAQAGLAKEE